MRKPTDPRTLVSAFAAAVAIGVAAMAPASSEAGATGAGEVRRPVADSPFFPYTYRPMPDNGRALRELGYSDFKGMFFRVVLTSDPPHPPNLRDRVREAAAAGPGILWLAVTWDEGDPASRAAMVAKIRELADFAAEVGWPASIYPHSGDTIDTAREALPLVEAIDHPNLGLTVNLSHELRNEHETSVPETIDRVWGRLNSVTINGADAVPEGKKLRAWKQLVQPLGEGSYDPMPLLEKLRDKGYTGPIGLQCYNIKAPTAEHLAASMEAWRGYLEGLAK